MASPLSQEPAPPTSSANPGVTLLAIIIIFTTLSVITTCFRWYARVMQRQVRLEDWAILIAALMTLVQLAFTALEFEYGSGRHIETLQPEQIVNAVKWIFGTETLLFPILTLTKISICFFVLRIKSTLPLRIGLYCMMTVLVLTTVACEIVLFAICQPLATFWDRTQGGTCWNFDIYNDVIWLQVASSILSDTVCTLLPIFVLWNVRIRMRLKITVCLLMALGVLATACGGVRASLSPWNEDPDLTFTLPTISMWAVLEIHLGIIGANMALAKYVWTYFFGVPEPDSTNRATGYGTYGNLSRLKGNTNSIPLRSKMHDEYGGIQKTTTVDMASHSHSHSPVSIGQQSRSIRDLETGYVPAHPYEIPT